MKTNKISFVSIWIMMVMAFCLNSCKERDVLHYSFSSYERSQSLIPACSQEGHIPKWLTSSIAGNPDCIDVALHLLKLDPQMKPIDFKPILEQYSYEEPKLKSRNDLREGDIILYHLDYGEAINPERGWIGVVYDVSFENNGVTRISSVGACRWNYKATVNEGEMVCLLTSYHLNIRKISVYRWKDPQGLSEKRTPWAFLEEFFGSLKRLENEKPVKGKNYLKALD
ncbi:hypothetical protein D8B45_08015 [Candidatus Gracilibacteria bacterium]|nr:MAG: hypothetical protein D8B45_08015 [Candidatus Gracilibacteria bacterium]